MSMKASEPPIQAIDPDRTHGLADPELRERFVAIPTTFKTLAFSGAKSASTVQASASYSGETQASANVWNAAHRVETPAFETEKFRPIPGEEEAASPLDAALPEPQMTAEKSIERARAEPAVADAAEEIPAVGEGFAGAETETWESVVVPMQSELENLSVPAGEPQSVDAGAPEPAAEEPLSWHRRLVRFTEKRREGETPQTESPPEHAGRADPPERVSQTALHGGERPVELIFSEATGPVAVYSSKTELSVSAPEDETALVEEVPEGSSRIDEEAATDLPDTAASEEARSEEDASAEDAEVTGSVGAETDSEEAQAFAGETLPPPSTETEDLPANEDAVQEEPPYAIKTLPDDVREVEEALPGESGGQDVQEEQNQEERRPRAQLSELPQESPMASTSRPRMMPPITMEAIPSLITSLSMGKHREEPVEILPPAKPLISEKPAPPVLNVAEGAARFRPGLARAVRYAALDDGPPARASEGLTAMRRVAREVVKDERQESLVPAPEPPSAQDTAPGMSRRWGMLSRFERGNSLSQSSDKVLAAAGTERS